MYDAFIPHEVYNYMIEIDYLVYKFNSLYKD